MSNLIFGIIIGIVITLYCLYILIQKNFFKYENLKHINEKLFDFFKTDQEFYLEGLKRLDKLDEEKIKEEEECKKEIEILKRKWELEEQNSCKGCVFLCRNDISNWGGEVEFQWECLKYNAYTTGITGILPTNSKPLSQCQFKHFSRTNPDDIMKFNK